MVAMPLWAEDAPPPPAPPIEENEKTPPSLPEPSKKEVSKAKEEDSSFMPDIFSFFKGDKKEEEKPADKQAEKAAAPLIPMVDGPSENYYQYHKIAPLAPIPEKKQRMNYRTQYLPASISKKYYDRNNGHLPPVTYVSEEAEDLMRNVALGNVPVIHAYIKKFNDTEIKDKEGNTPLIYACMAGNPYALKTLLSLSAAVNAQNRYGMTPLYAAVYQGRLDMVEPLLLYGANPDLPENSGITPLMLAVTKGYSTITDMLVKHGATLFARDHKGNTVLHIAATSQDPAALYTLLSLGASPDTRNFEGDTPLMFSAQAGNLANTQLLLKAGANTLVKNAEGKTAGDMAIQRAHPDVATAIENETLHRKILTHRLKEMRLTQRYHSPASITEKTQEKGTKIQKSATAATFYPTHSGISPFASTYPSYDDSSKNYIPDVPPPAASPSPPPPPYPSTIPAQDTASSWPTTPSVPPGVAQPTPRQQREAAELMRGFQ